MFKPKNVIQTFMLSTLSLAILTACGGSSKEDTALPTPPVATAPIAQSDTAVSLNNAVIDIDVLANDAAGNGGPMRLDSVTTPTRGTVSIVDNKIRYTPAETFLGSDSFSYTVSSGTLNATATVTVSGHQSLILSGRVIDSPIANASVKVSINGETFTATADTQGFYQLSVLLTSLLSDELIRITAQGVAANNQEYVTLSSLTKTAADLLTLRGEDQTITRTDLDALQLTQLSTARDLLLQQISGEQILTKEQLAQAEIELDVEKLINTAAAIKLLVDDPAFSLPEGFTTIEQFVLNADAFAAFIRDAAEGENSPLSQAKSATLADPEVTPAVKPLAGNYIRIFDSPAFMTSTTSENLFFSESGITFYQQTNETGEFSPIKKEIIKEGSTITILDPELRGFRSSSFFPSVESYLPDDATRAAWFMNNCPSQIRVNNVMGYSKLTVLEQTDNALTAQVDYFTRTVPDSSSHCAGIVPETITRNDSFTGKFVTEASLTTEDLVFDLSQTKQWVLPDVSGSMFGSDLFTLKDDGTFETLTGFYEGSILTWSLSEDKKTLTLKDTNAFDSGEFNQMDLQLSRTLDHAFSVVVKYSNEEADERYVMLRNALPVMGDGIVAKLTETAGTNKFISSAVNSRAKEWQDRTRLPGDWFGWALTSSTEMRQPQFRCDGDIPLVGEVCDGEFTAFLGGTGAWEVKDNALHIERGNPSWLQDGICVADEPCNLRVIVPLYEKEGVITGYEYNIIRRNQYQIMPRVMFWTLPELPPLQ